MPFPDPIFPGAIWDGSTGNRNRVNEESYVSANGDDFFRLAAEIISMQKTILPLVTTVTGDTTVLPGVNTVLLVDASAGDITVTLPETSESDTPVVVKKVDASVNKVTVQGNQTIDGETNQEIFDQYVAITVVSNGAEWAII